MAILSKLVMLVAFGIILYIISRVIFIEMKELEVDKK